MRCNVSLLGGPMNGRVLNVDDDLEWLEFAEPPEVTITARDLRPKPPGPNHAYRRAAYDPALFTYQGVRK